MRFTATGSIMDGASYQFRYFGTGDWTGDTLTKLLRDAQERAARQLEADIDDEMVCILSAAIL